MKIDIASHPACNIYNTWKEYLPGQKQLAILDISEIKTLQDYVSNFMNPTARNRYRYSCRHYTTQQAEYNKYLDEIHEINISAPVRQNNPMREHYVQKPTPRSEEKIICEEHYTRFYGCFSNSTEKLVAYATIHVSGELCAVTQIIGHADYLRDDIMLNLFATLVEFAINAGIKCMLYSRWTDGTDGLRHWKYSVGFRCDSVELINT